MFYGYKELRNSRDIGRVLRIKKYKELSQNYQQNMSFPPISTFFNLCFSSEHSHQHRSQFGPGTPVPRWARFCFNTLLLQIQGRLEGKVERGWDRKVRSWEEIGRVKLRRAMLCVRGEECQYLAVKYRVEEIMFLPHEAFHYFKLPLQSLLKDPSSSSPDKSFNKGTG